MRLFGVVLCVVCHFHRSDITVTPTHVNRTGTVALVRTLAPVQLYQVLCLQGTVTKAVAQAIYYYDGGFESSDVGVIYTATLPAKT